MNKVFFIKEYEDFFKIEEYIKNKNYFQEWLSHFSEIKINKKNIDKTIYKILFKIYENDLVKKLYENVFESDFYNGCDQYSICLAIVLFYKKYDSFYICGGYRLDEKEYLKKKIISKKQEIKNFCFGFNPHFYLCFSINNNRYILSPKYFKINNNKLISNIPCEYHSTINKEYMLITHQDSLKKSLFFSDVTVELASSNFPIYIKEKNKSLVIYKTFRKIILI